MIRLGAILSMAVAMAFAVNLGAQPPERGGDGPPRDGDRGPRGDFRRGDGDRYGGRDFRFRQFRMPNPVLEAIDANDDNELSEEEINNASKALLALDKNGDKKLSGEELRPEFPGRGLGPGGSRPIDSGQMVDRILENDANDDGKLTKDEMPERLQQGFDRIDDNGDGSVDRAELEQWAARFNRGPGGRDGDRGPGGRDGGDRGPRGDGDGRRGDGDRDRGPRDDDRPASRDDL